MYRRSTGSGTSSLTLESASFGGFLTKVGAAEAAFGGTALAAGATSVSVSGGTLVFVGGLVAAIGAEELVKGVVTAAGGRLMMMNSSKNPPGCGISQLYPQVRGVCQLAQQDLSWTAMFIL